MSYQAARKEYVYLYILEIQLSLTSESILEIKDSFENLKHEMLLFFFLLLKILNCYKTIRTQTALGILNF